jgi:polyisoprenoid-binding protein YceI
MRPTDRHSSNILVASALALALSAGTALAATETLNIDPNHSRVGFSIRHFFTPVRGEFKTVKGTIQLDQANLNASTVNVEIATASINTNNDKRDDHLRSADFFDAEKNPTVTFVSKSIAVKDNKGTMTGDLTMHGITKPVTLALEVGGIGKMGQGGTIAGFTATGKLDRKDYGILWNKTLDQGGTMLGDDVTLEITVEAKTPPPPKPAETAAAGK